MRCNVKARLAIALVATIVAAYSSPGRSEWQSFGVADGLSDNQVHALLEDQSGNLWFGTWGGASRYDGVNWTTYTESDGLASNTVFSITEDSSANLWFGTSHGVSRYDGVSWTTYTTADGLVNSVVSAILEDSHGSLWFGTWGGVSRYDGVSWTTYTESDGLADNFVTAITEDSDENLWFGTGDGVSRYDGVSWTTYTESDGLADNFVTAITEDSDENLWFGTGHGVSRYDGVSWTTYTESDGLADDYVLAIAEDGQGNLWFGTFEHGASRYDGMSWRTYTEADGLVHDFVTVIVKDSHGNLWFGTNDYGASRYDGVSWITYTAEDGLADNIVRAVTQDSKGKVWFAVGYASGVSCYDGASWRTYTEADGLADDYVLAITEDSHGNLWFGTDRGGVSRYDGVSWTTYTAADGLAENTVRVITEDRDGNLWFGGGDDAGVSRYDGANWATYTIADGLASNFVNAITEDSRGNLWFGTWSGVSCYNGANWITYTTAEGIADNWVYAITGGRNGCLWFGTGMGVTLYEPDRVAPQTVIWPRPPLLSPNTIQTITFSAAFGEVDGITFSYSMDGSAWSEWSWLNSWTVSGLSDGDHVFRAMARDRAGNVDSIPAVCVFEIDATAPAPVITYPSHREAVRGSVTLLGTAADLRFGQYGVETRAVGNLSWDRLAFSETPVIEGILGEWDTEPLPDGDYDIRLSVKDTLGLTGIDQVQVVVDNEAPWAWETSPAVVSAATGGDVYTTNGEIHLYFSPHAFDEAAEVSIDPAGFHDGIPEGAEIVDTGYEISWKGERLRKAAVLEMALSDSVANGSHDKVLALYILPEGQEWLRLGGTISGYGMTISAPLECEGIYCLCRDGGAQDVEGGLSPILFAPRVFSPRGSFGDTEVSISFRLGRAGPVTVKIYNRAGNLVDEIVKGKYMNLGANVVRWDGRDGDGGEVPSGLYLVTVEAMGQTRVKTLGVVR